MIHLRAWCLLIATSAMCGVLWYVSAGTYVNTDLDARFMGSVGLWLLYVLISYFLMVLWMIFIDKLAGTDAGFWILPVESYHIIVPFVAAVVLFVCVIAIQRIPALTPTSIVAQNASDVPENVTVVSNTYPQTVASSQTQTFVKTWIMCSTIAALAMSTMLVM